jgi:hypothetical protein
MRQSSSRCLLTLYSSLICRRGIFCNLIIQRSCVTSSSRPMTRACSESRQPLRHRDEGEDLVERFSLKFSLLAPPLLVSALMLRLEMQSKIHTVKCHLRSASSISRRAEGGWSRFNKHRFGIPLPEAFWHSAMGSVR